METQLHDATQIISLVKPPPVIKEDVTQQRLILKENGYPPVPVSGHFLDIPSAGKRPLLNNWQTVCESATADTIRSWTHTQRDSTNTGILCGHIVAVDIDVPDENLSSQIEALARKELGDTPLKRIGRPPKMLLVFRTATPLKKIKTPDMLMPDGTKFCVELLGQGQQFVAFGFHPETKAEYIWPYKSPLDVPADELPLVTKYQCLDFLRLAENLMCSAGAVSHAKLQKTERDGRKAAMLGDSDVPSRQLVEAALGHIPNHDASYDEWIMIGMALHSWSGDDGKSLWEAWSARHHKNNPVENAKKWASFSAGGGVKIGTLFWMAQANGWHRDSQYSTSSAPEIYKGTPDDPEWPDLVPLEVVALPDLPDDIFPGWVGDMVNAVAASTETPRELAAGFALGVIAVSIQGKIKVHCGGDHYEPLNVWTVTALPSGNRKSAVLALMTLPLIEWESAKAELMKPEIARAISERKTAEAQIAAMRSKAAREKDAMLYEDMKREIAEMEMTLPEIPKSPRLLVQDVSVEKMPVTMQESGGKLGMASAEGGIFDILGGRYSNGVANLDAFLQSHSGDMLRVDRIGREAIYIREPALTIMLAPQPAVIINLAENPAFRGCGLLARILFSLPTSLLGRRTLESRPVPDAVKDKYGQAIRRLLDIQLPLDDDGRSQPYVLKLSNGAHAELKAMSHYVEKNMLEGGLFECINDWASKLPGAAARIAGLFHCAEHTFGEPWAHEISVETMNRALRLAVIFSKHALAVFALIGEDASLEGARKIYRWLDRKRPSSFTARDAFRDLQGSFPNMEAMRPGLGVLVERGFVRERASGERGRGRPHSPEYDVNPKLWDAK